MNRPQRTGYVTGPSGPSEPARTGPTSRPRRRYKNIAVEEDKQIQALVAAQARRGALCVWVCGCVCVWVCVWV